MSQPQSDSFVLNSPPTDGITRVRFVPQSPLLLASSWDNVSGLKWVAIYCSLRTQMISFFMDSKGVRLYDVSSNQLKSVYHHKAAVLDCTHAGRTHAFSGGLDLKVVMCVAPPPQKNKTYIKLMLACLCSSRHDFTTEQETVLGEHERAIRCIEYSQMQGTDKINSNNNRQFVINTDQNTNCILCFEIPLLWLL